MAYHNTSPDPRFPEGARFHLRGDSRAMWIKDYNVRVCTEATVLQQPRGLDQKVYVRLDSIDGDSNVCTYIRKQALISPVRRRKPKSCTDNERNAKMVREQAGKPAFPLTKAALIAAIKNTYEGTEFLVGIVLQEGENFLHGTCRHLSKFWTREQLLAAIEKSSYEVFPLMPEHPENLLISDTIYLWRNSINHSQVFPETPDANVFYHICDPGNKAYDVYFLFDHEEKLVTFALGKRVRTIPLEEYTEWAWKLTPTKLKCGNSYSLESSFLDEHWAHAVVNIGRKALGIRDIV